SGATSSSYKINSAKKIDVGKYTITVSNSAGYVTSTVAILTVNTVVKPSIIHQPTSQTVNEENLVEFAVVASDVTAGNKDFSTPLSNNVNLDMVWINPGTFMMGSPEGEIGREMYLSTDETQHEVTLTQGYWLGKYSVTQAQYEVIMGENPSCWNGADLPVEQVNWYDANSFCAKLTEIERAAGRLPAGYEYTLPTEAQWEYACRAGTTTALNSGKNLTSTEKCPNVDEVGWYLYNSDEKTHPVGQKKPNAWGLYDMYGNVCDWCLDHCTFGNRLSTDTYIDGIKDPLCKTGSLRVIRGGAWNGYAYGCRSAWRNYGYPDGRLNRYGFRVALVLVDPSAAQPIVNNLTYQWYKDGKAISGATSSSYKINSVKMSDSGKYTVTVSNSAGSVTSAVAALTVEAISASAVKPLIIDQPESQTVNEGGSVTFSVTTSETGTLRYQWKKDGIEIISVDPATSSYTIRNVAASDAGSYTVTVSNEFGSVTSKAATLTVESGPTISFVVEGDGTSLILNFVGTLYESDDAVNWRVVEGAKAPFTVDTSKGKKFYRCAQ
ncbi:MAG: SUMF1/EgtB/PvdO family nonheme iron enzyme, partial [Verrucomicrobia bacterium]|nr:SUMF1/EgtB/PvdO family nonheme iron enzyme [Verrucomicrobiota bacterium]